MTMSSDAVADGLWLSRAAVINECWVIYSPSSCMSSQPCSPGPTGGLVGQAEKCYGELTALPYVAHESLYGCKRTRSQADASVRACVQGNSHIEATQAASSQLVCSRTPSSLCGLESILKPSGDLSNFCAKLSSVYFGNGATSTHRVVQPAVASSSLELTNHHTLNMPPSDGLHCGGVVPSAVIRTSTSSLPWHQLPQHNSQQQQQQPLQQLDASQHSLQHFQQLHHLQQQIAQLIAEQSALALSTTTGVQGSSSVLNLTPLCDLQPRIPQPDLSLPSSTSCLSGAECGAQQLGGLSLPFIFTGMDLAQSAPQPLPPAVAPVSNNLSSLPRTNFSVCPLDGSGPLALPADPRISGVNAAGFSAGFTSLSATGTAGLILHPCSLAPQLRYQQQQVSQQLDHVMWPVPSDVQIVSHSQPQLAPLLQTQPQFLLQHLAQPLKVRHSVPRRMRPPSPSPPVSPCTPTTHPMPRGPEDWILHVTNVLGMREPDTARLALHCWRRVSQLPQLHHATRLWTSVMAGRHLYATACLWVSIKLEERRRAAPGGVVIAHLASTTPAVLCSAELAVMNWIDWRPYDGYRLDESHLLVYM